MKYLVRSLRTNRRFHRFVGTSLSILFIISALTGILLALKKDSDIIQPPTQKGESSKLSEWLPLSSVDSIARAALYKYNSSQKNNPVDRMDARPSKGIVKVLFKNGYWEVQVDASTGKVKSIARRHSDWIEALHDGSIVSHIFKLVSMNLIGFGLLFLIGSGLWLWYGPKLIRQRKKFKR